MLSVNQVVAQFLIQYPEAGSAQALTLFNASYREIIAGSEIRYTQGTLNLVAGQRSYALPDGTIDMLQVYYALGSDSSDRRVLTASSADAYAGIHWGYRVNEDNIQGGPQFFWIESKPVGNSAGFYISLDPIPDTTTSSGYPCLLLNYNLYADMSGSDTIPSSMLNETCILNSMWLKWAQMNDKKSVGLYQQTFQVEFDKMNAHIAGAAQQYTSKMAPAWLRRRSS